MEIVLAILGIGIFILFRFIGIRIGEGLIGSIIYVMGLCTLSISLCMLIPSILLGHLPPWFVFVPVVLASVFGPIFLDRERLGLTKEELK